MPQVSKTGYMHKMDAYIPPPSSGATSPLSRGDHGQEDLDDMPRVPPSNFFSMTLPPSTSLSLFNQPAGLHSGPIIHFHTPLQNTLFLSVSQSLPPSPLPSSFVRDPPPHLNLSDGAAPFHR